MQILNIGKRQRAYRGLGLILLLLLAGFFVLQIQLLIAQEKADIAMRKGKGRSVEQIFNEVDEIRKMAGCEVPVFYITAQPQVVEGIDPTGVAHFGLTPCRVQLARELPAPTADCNLLIHASHPAYQYNDFGQSLYESENFKLYRCRLP